MVISVKFQIQLKQLDDVKTRSNLLHKYESLFFSLSLIIFAFILQIIFFIFFCYRMVKFD